VRIYPSLHSIKEVQKVELQDIPLAYVDTSNTEQYINIAKEPIFANSYGEDLIKAYEEFDNPEAYLFNESNEIIKSQILKRLGNRYVYEPQNAVEFTPLRFAFDVLVKKNMAFKNNKHYNLKVAVHEEGLDLAFAKQLISVFGDAPRRGVCPANISVNDQAMTPETLINASFKGNDFIFIKSTDGIHFKEGTNTLELDVDALMDMNVNIWLSVDSFGDVLKTRNSNLFTMKAPALYATTDYAIKDYGYYFDNSAVHASYPKDKYTYATPFSEYSAALVLEKANGGFVIVTHKSFFDNLHENAKLLYELMMQSFLKAYYRTKQFNSWITDQPVDYIAYKASKYNLRHASVNLNDLLRNENYDIGDEYNLLDVKTSNSNVLFVNMSPKKDLFFYKVNVQPDPIKNEGDISVYTSRHSVIHYKQEVIKKLESGLDISTDITETGLYVTVHPCRSTQYRINATRDRTLRIEDPRLEYTLCCKPGSTDVENDFILVRADDYTGSDGLKVATVRVTSKPDAKTFDIRINGGGLPLDKEPNYNLLDIGHINGRPYRVGSTLIIRLPARLKEHATKIKQAIEKHSSSGDYPVIIYE
jgi:hypothetical protein